MALPADSSEPPQPCDDPRPSYDSQHLGGIFACEGCGYLVELCPRGLLWQHYVPLVLLRPVSLSALLHVLPLDTLVELPEHP